MVVVGTNPRALRFARKIEARPELGYRISRGFVDGPWAGMEFSSRRAIPRRGPAGLPRFLREQVVDEVVIALPDGILLRQGGAHRHALRGASSQNPSSRFPIADRKPQFAFLLQVLVLTTKWAKIYQYQWKFLRLAGLQSHPLCHSLSKLLPNPKTTILQRL